MASLAISLDALLELALEFRLQIFLILSGGYCALVFYVLLKESNAAEFRDGRFDLRARHLDSFLTILRLMTC